ncbi:MAG: PEP-CTERM sorting domain-containing protein [Gemmatimonas sp.]
MKKSLFHCLSAAALLAVPLSAAHANLILAGEKQFGGTGLGTVNTILTISSSGSATTETGCVTFGGATGSAFLANGMCTGSNGDVKTGASQTQTRTLLETGVTSAANFGIVFNAAEPGGDAITLNDLTVSFFSPAGLLLYQASTVPGVNGEPFLFPATNTGTGNAGFLFVLDAGQQSAATSAGVFLNTANVIGLSASLSQATGGNETFFVANTGGLAVVPEPSTYALMAAGLAGIFGFARRRRQA